MQHLVGMGQVVVFIGLPDYLLAVASEMGLC